MSDVVIVAIVSGAFTIGGIVATWLMGRRKTAVEVEAMRRKIQTDEQAAKRADLVGRFDDVDQLMAEIERRVEAKAAPLRAELERQAEELEAVKRDSHEMRDTFRAWVSAVSIWDRTGRHGTLPMLPAEVLHRLGLSHIASTDP